VPTLDLMDVERQVIDHALKLSGGNRTRAAALLGIDVRTLRRKLNGPAREAGPASASDGSPESPPPPARLPVPASRLPDKLPQGN
jgi:hypothetical protein